MSHLQVIKPLNLDVSIPIMPSIRRELFSDPPARNRKVEEILAEDASVEFECAFHAEGCEYKSVAVP
jgi:hypothetical protein